MARPEYPRRPFVNLDEALRQKLCAAVRIQVSTDPTEDLAVGASP